MRNITGVLKLLFILILFISCSPKNKIDTKISTADQRESTGVGSDSGQNIGNRKAVKVQMVKNIDWHIENLDDNDRAGIQNSIAIDSHNKVHISYYDAGLRILAYATNRSGKWKEYKVKGTDNQGEFNSIAVDSEDNVHISYVDDPVSKNLRYIKIEGNKTSKKVIDSGDWIGFSTSIALDKNDHVYISYLDDRNRDSLKYATNKDGKWMGHEIYKARLGIANASLSVDNNGKIHISFIADSDLFYTTNKNGTWKREKVHDADYALKNVGISSSIKADSKGNVHIVMGAGSDGLLYFTNESGKGKKYELYKEEFGICEEAALAIDKNDKLHIAFRMLVMNAKNWEIDVSNDVYYATNKNGKWQISKVESIGTEGTGLSIAVDNDGYVHMCYNTLNKNGEGSFHYATNRPVSMAKLAEKKKTDKDKILLASK